MIHLFLRSLLIYLFIVAVTRLCGKAQVGQMTPVELVFSLLVADIAATPMESDAVPLLHGFLPILGLLLGQMTLSVLTMKSPRLRRLFTGEPTVVIFHGKWSQRALRDQRMTADELLEELRIQGYMDPSEINIAILETSGDLSVFPYAQYAPLTAQDADCAPPESGMAYHLITDGIRNEANLTARGHNRPWLDRILHQNGVKSPAEAFLLTVNEQGGVFFQKKEGGR